MKKLILFLAIIAFFQVKSTAQKDKQYKVGVIGFWNFENLFDLKDSPDTNDKDFLPTGKNQWNKEKYDEKMGNLARVISDLGTELSPEGATLLGTAEVENRKVLEDLVKEKAIKDRNYQIVHHDSPDWRGIDCALLYNPKYFTPTSSKGLEVELFNDEGERRYTRDVLYVNGKLDGDEIHIFVCHWPSRRGGEKASRHKRNKAAQVVKDYMKILKDKDPEAKIIVMGDMNDDPVSPSVKNILQGKKDKESVTKNSMYNPMYKFYKRGVGSNAYRDAWSLFDQILLTKPLLGKKQDGYFHHKTTIYNKKYLVQKTGKYKGYPYRTFAGGKYQGGFSDHFPVYITLLKEIK
ncbi:MAG: endonuclease/exonuclease/phosphatase family protein [Saprospiraceae bacterium]